MQPSHNEWVAAIKESALPENSCTVVFPKGLPIFLARKTALEIYAISNKCAHMGCPLTNGELDGYTLQCPCHDWRFDIRTGVFIDAPEIRLSVYDWKISNGEIMIKL